MADPKWVIAFGACASSGGFYDNYATVQGIDKLIPVDAYIPGCPPRPETILDSLMKLQRDIQRGKNPILQGDQQSRIDAVSTYIEPKK